jgi:hypothetical protein
MTASGPASLSMSIVLARRNPASLACDLASAETAMYQLAGTLGDSRTYRSGKRSDKARRQTKAVARQLRRISRRLYTGSCGPARRHKRLGRYVSVHDRDALDDGDLKAVAKQLARLARVLRKVDPGSGASMVVRDTSGESTSSSLGEVGRSLAVVLYEIVIDLTAADLSGIGPDQLPGVHAIWSSGTVWPSGLADRIRASSEEVGPGVFLVRLPV